MNWWLNFGCKLTGWNKQILSQCSEASRSQLSKYTSALLILMIVWGTTGYCFAQRYIGLPWWACGLVALVFITIVIMIERQIILAVHKTKSTLIFRIVIAIIMAFIGSTIFDQIMFGKDIDKQMKATIENQVSYLTPQRVGIINEKLTALNMEIDSIDRVNSALQADINAHPFINQISITSVSDGSIKKVPITSKTTNQVPNPKQESLETNNKTVNQLRAQEQKWTEKKQTVEEDVRKECKESVGFLEELEAMWSIISTRRLAGIFYFIFFSLLMSLELFVAVSKFGDSECDYDVAIKGAERVKEYQFGQAFAMSSSKRNIIQ